MLIIPQTIMPCKCISKKTPAASAEPAEPAEPDDSIPASPPPDELLPATKSKCKNKEHNPQIVRTYPKKRPCSLLNRFYLELKSQSSGEAKKQSTGMITIAQA